MLFKDLKQIINRSAGRHDYYSISIGLGNDAVIQAESPLLDALDDYEVSWIAPDVMGRSTVTDEDRPVIEVHLKEKPAVNPCKPEWIPVSERLPESTDDVLITIIDHESDREVYKGFFEDGQWSTQWVHGNATLAEGAIIPVSVVAWMPLPEPYKGK